MTNYVGITVSSRGIFWESSVGAWQITRTDSMGITLGLVWGPFRRPTPKSIGRNPWIEKPWFTIRLPFMFLPWIHMWRWGDADHPARAYIGGKVFYAHNRPNEDVWARPDERGKWYVTASASFRRGVGD